MRREGWLLWSGLLLVGAGVLLILIAWAGAERPLTQEPLAVPPTSPTPRSPTNVPVNQSPQPLVPTRTPVSPTPRAPTDIPVSRSPQPLVPTCTPARAMAATGASTFVAATPTRTPTPFATETPVEALSDPSPTSTIITDYASHSTDVWQSRPRWGVGVVNEPISWYNIASLRLGWYLDWFVRLSPARPEGIEYAQVLRLKGGTLQPNAETIAAVAQANPGSLWLVGNEPDAIEQDYLEPAVYTRLYHEAYMAIKTADPTAQVAIAGVIQPTPLRLRYLEAVLAAYQEQFGVEMPIDVWNVHNFILREERGTWGAFIPPGLPDDRGMLYEIEDTDNLEIFRQHIVDFRRWMAEHGYQNWPLIVSEYGIPMPEDYGFGFPPERVAAFLTGTFDYLLTAADPALGYPADGYRLVQRWCWYSLNAPDPLYPTGRLFDPQTKEMTAVGKEWEGFVTAQATRP